MANLPERPFLTEDFSLDGAGIDFLGLRWVNLRILEEYLLPGVNNATEDFGVYCLATWLPSKFRSLCKNQKEYQLRRFTAFRQAIEVAMAFVSRPDSPASSRFGNVHRQVGARQKLALPSTLDFERAQRTESTSVYAAPLYGPSLRYLGLLGYAAATDGSATDLLATAEDESTQTIVDAVEEALADARASLALSDVTAKSVTADQLDDMGIRGLHPAFWRRDSSRVKRAFLKKLLPMDRPNGRTRTAQLILQTLRSAGPLQVNALRHVWHCGLLKANKPHDLRDTALALQRDHWRMLMIRQFQRYILEEFLRCFERAILDGCRTLDEIAQYALGEELKGKGTATTLRDLFLREAAPVLRSKDLSTIGDQWATTVDRTHLSYVGAIQLGAANAQRCGPALRSLARWWFGSMRHVAEGRNTELAALGGQDRVSIRWFHRHWVHDRLDLGLFRCVREVFEQLIFGQHIRIALSRFDGQGQRLRFMLGDRGIVPTRSMEGKLAEEPGWMADRLDAFVNLLCDTSVLTMTSEGTIEPGRLADAVTSE